MVDNDDLRLSLTLSCPKTTTTNQNNLMPCLLSSFCSSGGAAKLMGEEEEANSTVTCMSGKRRERSESQEEEEGRKKLRLSKEQSAVLEDSFKENHTLNPKQKVGLAMRLGLRARQVEVWFQNRRARTKLKQTETECEYMKKWCEQLSEDNRRLHKEVQELRALKMSPQFYMTPTAPATTLSVCAECQRRTPSWGAPVTRVEPIRP